MENLKKAVTKCLLIQPQISRFSSLNYIEVCQLVGAKYPTPPLGLLTVAALLPQHWDFKLIDANVEALSDQHFQWADIVCTGGILSQQLEIFEIIEKAHHYNKKVVVGGPEPSSQPQYYSDVDFLIIGEGENTIPQLLQDLEKGCQIGIYRSDEFTDMTTAVVPRFDLINFADYLMMGIQFSRGCPYNCEFCNVIEIFGRGSRTKTAKQIIKELQTLYDFGYRGRIFFVDDNFFGNRAAAVELLKQIKAWSIARHYPFYFAAEVTLNIAADTAILELAREVDFRYFSIGIETPDNNILQNISKTQNVNRQITEIIRKIYSYGIAVDTSLILGFDGENERTARNMINCIQEAGICMAMIGTLYALPNTQLAIRLEREGRLFQHGTLQKNKITDIDQMTSGLNFQTSRSKKEILEDYIQILETLYNPVNYYKRLLYTGLYLQLKAKYRPDLKRLRRNLSGFLRICLKAGFNKISGLLYWKTLIIILLKNPRSLEAFATFAAMYIHLSKHSYFIIELIKKRILELADADEPIPVQMVSDKIIKKQVK